MRKPKVTDCKYQSVNISSVKVWAYPPKERKEGEANGMFQVKFSTSYRYADEVVADFPLTSVWLDPHKTDSLRCCKVHAEVPRNPKTANQERACEIADFLLCMSGQRKIQVYGSPRMALTISDHDEIIRYGADESPYRASKSGSYETVPVFDSKAQAFASIIDAIKGYSSATVAGIDLINLNCISDAVLEEMGFAMSPDQMGVSVPMWTGDAHSITSLGRERYGSRRSSNSGDVTSKEIVESFLDLIELELIK